MSSAFHPHQAAARLLEQAEAQDRIAEKFEARALGAEYDAQRAVDRGNQARGTALGARRAANRLRSEAERLSMAVTQL